MFCNNCGEELSDGVTFCSKCGTKQPGFEVNLNTGDNSNPGTYQNTVVMQQQASPAAKANSTASAFATVGFILGLVSWFLGLWGIVGITAIVFSSIALSNKNLNSQGKVFSIIGLVSGIINIIYVVCVFVRYM